MLMHTITLLRHRLYPSHPACPGTEEAETISELLTELPPAKGHTRTLQSPVTLIRDIAVLSYLHTGVVVPSYPDTGVAVSGYPYIRTLQSPVTFTSGF